MRNENGLGIPLINELDKQFSGVDGAFKSSIEKLIPICGLPPRKELDPWNMMLKSHINN